MQSIGSSPRTNSHQQCYKVSTAPDVSDIWHRLRRLAEVGIVVVRLFGDQKIAVLVCGV